MTLIRGKGQRKSYTIIMVFISYSLTALSSVLVTYIFSSSSDFHAGKNLTFVLFHYKMGFPIRVIVSDPEFIILENIDFPAIIGVEILQMIGLKLDFRTDTMQF